MKTLKLGYFKVQMSVGTGVVIQVARIIEEHSQKFWVKNLNFGGCLEAARQKTAERAFFPKIFQLKDYFFLH